MPRLASAAAASSGYTWVGRGRIPGGTRGALKTCAALRRREHGGMLIRVIWPNGREREVEIHTLRELDRFVGWHMQEGPVDLLPDDGEGLRLVVLAE
jgi:hypothetical protein